MGWWDSLWESLLSVAPNVWQILVALGTFLAVAASVAFGIAEGFKARRDRRELVAVRNETVQKERLAVAGLVSAWISDTYEPDPSRHSYKRKATLHVANESNEPVFNATANVHLGDKSRLIGPLGTPTPISVIPPRRELTWDISTGIRAFDDSSNPRVSLGFSDSQSRRWLRKVDGELTESTGKDVFHYAEEDAEGARAQLGEPDPWLNPMSVAFLFAHALWKDPAEFKLEELLPLLDEEANGWRGDWDEARVSELRELLGKYGNLATLAWYAAPKVAYARVFSDSSLNQVTAAGSGLAVDGCFITLTHHQETGWRVFGVGPMFRPDQIKFPDGEFDLSG